MFLFNLLRKVYPKTAGMNNLDSVQISTFYSWKSPFLKSIDVIWYIIVLLWKKHTLKKKKHN